MVRLWGSKGKRSGFSARSTAEEVTEGVDGRGLVAIITGASSGIGAEIARVLASRGVHVFMAVRNIDAGQNVKEAIIKNNPIAKVDVMKLELASQSSIHNFVLEFNSLNLPLNILINNAGILQQTFLLSQDQIELHFATNLLGHFLLTNLLLEKMKTTAQESNVEGRIVNVSSSAHKAIFRGIQFEKINDNSCYNALFGYSQSKLANILHSNELSRHLKEERAQITANSIHPGVIATNISRHSYIINRIIQVCAFTLKNVQQGAATTCYVALNPQVQGITGKYFCDCNESTPSCLARNSNLHQNYGTSA